jgi:hypothetical protein
VVSGSENTSNAKARTGDGMVFKVGIVASKKRWESDIHLFQRQPIGERNQIKMHEYV